MKILVSVLFLLVSSSAFANHFAKYLGEYDVVAQDCIVNGEQVIHGCTMNTVSIEEGNSESTIWLYTINEINEKVGKSLNEFEVTDSEKGKSYKATITGQESNATWSLAINVLQGDLKDRVRINETVNIYDRGDHLMYYYSYIERSSWRGDNRIFRTYKLVERE